MRTQRQLLLFSDIPEKLATTYYPGVFMPPLGLGALAGYLKQQLPEWTVVGDYLFDTLDEPKPLPELRRLIETRQPDVIGFTAMSANFPTVTALAAAVRPFTAGPLLLGGSHLSTCPDELPREFAAGVVGEGERTLGELLARFAATGEMGAPDIRGLVYFRDGARVRTEPRPPLDPLDQLPRFDFDLFPPPAGCRGTIHLSSRGCPYHCAFCNSAALWQKPRFFSATRVATDLAELRRRGYRKVAFYDDLFVADRRRIGELADRLAASGLARELELECLAHANFITPELVRDLRRMNITQVSLGVESGSPRILQYLKGGTLTVERIRAAVRLLRDGGIARVTGGFMVGTPAETAIDLEASVALARELRLSFTAVSLTTPYPGTQLWTDLVRAGKLGPAEPWTNELFGMTYYTDDELRSKRLFTDLNRETFIRLYRKLRDTADILNARAQLLSLIGEVFAGGLSVRNRLRRIRHLLRRGWRAATPLPA